MKDDTQVDAVLSGLGSNGMPVATVGLRSNLATDVCRNFEQLNDGNPYSNHEDDVNISNHSSSILESDQEYLHSPIQMLSAEILQHIFLFAISSTTEYHEFGFCLNRNSPRRPPRGLSWTGTLTLTWVCSWWRKVALSNPRLWCSIRLNAQFFLTDDSAKLNEHEWTGFVQECLRRSGPSLPIELGLRLDVDTRHSCVEPLLDELVDVVTDYAGRWKYLEFSPKRIQVLNKLFDISAVKLANYSSGTFSDPGLLTSFPFLEEMRIDYPWLRPFNSTGLFRLFNPCPRLHTFRSSRTLRETDNLDMSNLTLLEVRSYSGRSFGSLLGQCPCLKYLSMQYFHRSQNTSANPVSTSLRSSPVLTHTNLTSLSLFGIGERFDTGVWNSVRLPNLTRLAVAFELDQSEEDEYPDPPSEYFHHDNALEELKDMCILSGCVLQKLWVYTAGLHARVPEDEVHDILVEISRAPGYEYYIDKHSPHIGDHIELRAVM